MTDQSQTDAAAQTDTVLADGAPALPPREPALPPREWVKKNLFSSVGSSILTVVFVVVILAIFQGILSFAFAEDRRWDSTATNMRLLMAGAYPQSQFIRMWVSLGSLVALAGLSAGVWRAGGRTYVAELANKIVAIGGVLALVGLLAPISGTGRVYFLAIGAGLAALALSVRKASADDMTVPSLGVALAGVSLAVGSLWVVPIGHHAFADGEVITRSGTVASSTKLPLTMMIVIAVLGYIVGRAIANRVESAAPRTVLAVLWLISPMIIVFFVMRDPAFDYGHVVSTELPILLGYALVGGLLLFLLASPTIGEIGRVVAAVVLLATFLTPMLQVVRILALMLAVFALAAPTFSGNRSARLRYWAIWASTVTFTLWMVTAINAPSTVDSPASFFTGGLTLTLIVASFTMILSFPFGVMLALARTSKMPIFRVMSTVYIEFVRGVPLITILIFFSILFPLFLPQGMSVTEIAVVTIGFTMFSAAYLAENVRGGLQSVRRGQYEAAEALGMTTSQKTLFIVLPQALRVSIPPLVGQTIATFKETSLLAVIGVFDLLYVGRTLIPAQTSFIGTTREQLLFVSAVYWIGSYSMSRASRNLERKLGVGER